MSQWPEFDLPSPCMSLQWAVTQIQVYRGRSEDAIRLDQIGEKNTRIEADDMC